jgi:glycosyltransferase involved in cell wall biosynthesis
MSKQPFISIIVPAHNNEEHIGQTLESIRAQSIQDWECVVVDDGSSDKTCAVVEAVCAVDGRVRLVRQSRGGASTARNRGFLESSPASEYVSFMDADDVWEADALETLVGRLLQVPEAIGAHGIAEFIDAHGRPLNPGGFSSFGRRRLGYRDGAIREWPVEEPTVFETLVWTGPLYPPGLLLARREAYERAGFFDVQLRHCEDWDMCLRLSRLGCLEFVDKVLLSYRRHGHNQSSDPRGSAAMVQRLHHKTFFSPENTPKQLEMLRAGWKAWQWYKVKEKWARTKSVRMRDLPHSLFHAVAGVPLHLMRYMRGHPTASGFLG